MTTNLCKTNIRVHARSSNLTPPAIRADGVCPIYTEAEIDRALAQSSKLVFQIGGVPLGGGLDSMRIHPAPVRRNITLRYDVPRRQKQLRRLPHIFAKVLELPFRSDADVLVEQTADCFRFVVGTDEIGGGGGGVVRADTVEIYPGVTKIVIRGTDVLDFAAGELELDMWRFRLPASTRPDLATAEYNSGELVVTVPKDGDRLDDGGRWREDGGDFGAARLVLVQ